MNKIFLKFFIRFSSFDENEKTIYRLIFLFRYSFITSPSHCIYNKLNVLYINYNITKEVCQYKLNKMPLRINIFLKFFIWFSSFDENKKTIYRLIFLFRYSFITSPSHCIYNKLNILYINNNIKKKFVNII